MMRLVFFETRMFTRSLPAYLDDELMQGVDDMRQERLGKITLRTHVIDVITT